ncbi:UDP-N-acetylmuramate:L-alanyl-gamma-D-glutamyl-meso-diaminopimelate ligase [Thiobacillus denitrificans]|uniref:UDP-N-acetylmuramate--L-alanyl-gamma-D-glutamyl-meso-2,6-diaminoheptandioate ligase n=1 Tax=Thiobacillus denitrificans TaxID=36861 RepID=A0A106BQA5_THIDE|nr:UDP-N-acetylmuramate:L-alanyl-gamma-D-glutamyl-meso-diaminopimelate ligase [Thiobacillus denitrificans]KVW96683.1 UDP-N-acetylmuramate:L-alanyl-gamma-D-glutamyl-meso-diaminopimelate ligase [Thiobacillus denitrificans]
MHLHILGICGTFMGGLAAIARNAGHTVTGCDANVYPPMSDQLRALGIELTEGWDASQANIGADIFVVGNVVTRGNPLMEALLERGLPYTSGPQWLADNVLRDKWVLAVAGTHGKTTTAAMLAWILDDARMRPGFLIGGIPQNFGLSARLTDSPFFVIEADEYDTAFFDKRSKFVHYRPRSVILNNLEYDHADIFPDLAAIEIQFHHLVRTVPGNGLIVANGTDANLDRVFERGLWTPVERFGGANPNGRSDGAGGWTAGEVDSNGHFDVFFDGALQGRVKWALMGEHNRMNALASIAAARHAGVPAAVAIDALSRFENVKRRMEIRGAVHGITVYDDFAHHPTAITTTVEGLRAKVGRARILAVLEPRSNTMKLGVMKAALPASLAFADLVYCYGANLGWDAAEALAPLGNKARVFDDLDSLVSQLVADARPGDHVLMMSNGGFGGIHAKLLDALHNHYHEDIVLAPMHRHGGYA